MQTIGWAGQGRNVFCYICASMSAYWHVAVSVYQMADVLEKLNELFNQIQQMSVEEFVSSIDEIDIDHRKEETIAE